MRFLFALIIFVMALAILVFAINNVGTTVPVTLLSTLPDQQLIVVVFSAIAFGACFIGIVAIVEGAKTRLENRRLRREVHKLETELNFLRTEPRLDRQDPAAPGLPPAPAEARETEDEPPSAPVYDARDESGEDADPEDDMYAGGRAV